jgi:hypothetical protein
MDVRSNASVASGARESARGEAVLVLSARGDRFPRILTSDLTRQCGKIPVEDMSPALIVSPTMPCRVLADSKYAAR